MNKFDDIRPYTDEEIPDAMQRIVASTSFPLVASYVFPERTLDDVRKELLTYKTIRDFQMGVMYWANKQIMKRSISDFTYGGLGQLSTDTNYLYVSNHRDIMLDASLMQNVLTDNDFDTCEITFGANLMQGQMVIDVGKSNKMFRVERPGGSVKEFYKASLHLSDYIRTAITEKRQSVWIAQRNGRTKDGIDRTDQGIIKMFGMSRTDDKVKSLAQLNIVPVAVSYEWESCNILKTIELYERRQGPYIKKPGEDLNSIMTGIVQWKGRVHMALCEPIHAEELAAMEGLTNNEYHKAVAGLIDRRINGAYQLWPNNYVAHDMLYGNGRYRAMYTDEECEAFRHHLAKLDRYAETCDIEHLREIFLGIYANPVDNR